MSGSAILTDLGLGASFERALEKLRGGLGDVQRRAAEHARKRIHIDQRRWNQADTRSQLVEGLEQHLNEVRVEQVGCVALFSGRA